jgi:hypothetical protein
MFRKCIRPHAIGARMLTSKSGRLRFRLRQSQRDLSIAEGDAEAELSTVGEQVWLIFG